MTSENPFERFDLDPLEGPLGITEQLRERAESAATDEDREAVRAVWEQLTRHPRERVRLALLAHPESRAPLPQPSPAKAASPPETAPAEFPRAVDFFEPLSVESALLAALQRTGVMLPRLDDALSPSLDHDPILMGHPAREGKA